MHKKSIWFQDLNKPFRNVAKKLEETSNNLLCAREEFMFHVLMFLPNLIFDQSSNRVIGSAY